MQNTAEGQFTPYLSFSREEWKSLRAVTPMTLSESDLVSIRGITDKLSLEEVADIYLPLSRLLSLYVSAVRDLHGATSTFLGSQTRKVPFIIGIAGSVAVGKSTTARILQALLSRWPNQPKVDLVTTDGFLYPNKVLQERGLMRRKGFPESYDIRRLVKFMRDVKSGVPEAAAPVYSHLTYDIVPDELQVVRQPDIMILEGLNVLQVPDSVAGKPVPQVFISDFFDFSIYVDANPSDLTQWYIQRFLKLCETAFQNPQSYFHRYSTLTEEEARQTATSIWKDINEANLIANILPTRGRANLILEKGTEHIVKSIRLRKL